MNYHVMTLFPDMINSAMNTPDAAAEPARRRWILEIVYIFGYYTTESAVA